MRTVLRSDDFEELVHVVEVPDNFQTDSMAEHHYQLNYQGIRMKGTSVMLDGVKIDQSEIEQPHESRVYVKKESPHLEIHFELNGQTNFESKTEHGLDVEIPSGNSAFFFFPELDGRLNYSKCANRSMLEVEFSVDYLTRLLGNDLSTLGHFGEAIKKGRPAIYGNQSQRMSPLIKSVIGDIIHCKFTGVLKKVYLEAKMMELVTLQIAQQNSDDSAKTNWRKDEVEKLEFAKELVEKNILTPCSIIELAEMTGLNDFKLKKGFKELFGNTVFGYLTDIRMEQAKTMILEGNTITEVSDMVGYKNPQHFTVAFKKKFGFLPRELKR